LFSNSNNRYALCILRYADSKTVCKFKSQRLSLLRQNSKKNHLACYKNDKEHFQYFVIKNLTLVLFDLQTGFSKKKGKLCYQS